MSRRRARGGRACGCPPPIPSALKAVYDLSEWAALTGESREAVRRQAERGHLPTVKVGGVRKVSLAEVQVRFPSIWEGILLRLSLAAAAHGGPGGNRSGGRTGSGEQGGTGPDDEGDEPEEEGPGERRGRFAAPRPSRLAGYGEAMGVA